MNDDMLSGDLDGIQDKYRLLQIQEELEVKKAIESGDPQKILKAEKYMSKKKQKGGGASEPKSLFLDPFQKNINFGYLQKSSNVGFSVLRSMSMTPIPRAIINTRKEQFLEFCVPRNGKGNGFVVRKKKTTYNQTTEEDKVTKQEQKRLDELTEFVLNCGSTSKRWQHDDFETFVRKVLEDSLSLDQLTFEVVRNMRQGEKDIVEVVATDGASFRLADTHDQEDKKAKKSKLISGYLPSYVQLIDGKPETDFYPWELGFGVRNPQTNIRTYGYGRSELEDLINTVTDLLNASSYNSNYFRIGSNPKGILRVKNLNTNRIEEFRQNWMTEMSGVRNAHKLPIIDADQMDFINTQSNNKDMEYHKYMEFLIKISCAHFKISPEEIGFPLEGTGHSGLGNSDNETELKYSKSKGLHPLLRFFQRLYNKMVMTPLTEGWAELCFVGQNSEDEKRELEEDIKKVQNGGISQQDFFKKYSGKEADFENDIILNPVYLQYKQMQMMGDPESNEFMDEELEEVEQDNTEEENPFLNKAVEFVEKNLSND